MYNNVNDIYWNISMDEMLAIAIKIAGSTLGFHLDGLNVETGRWIIQGYEISKYNKDDDSIYLLSNNYEKKYYNKYFQHLWDANLKDYKEELLTSFESHKILDQIYGYTY